MLQGYFLGLATSPAVVNILHDKFKEHGPFIKDFLVYFFRPYYVAIKSICCPERYTVRSLDETFGPEKTS
jgi:hypothetical protein